jgi:hypothetical protein
MTDCPFGCPSGSRGLRRARTAAPAWSKTGTLARLYSRATECSLRDDQDVTAHGGASGAALPESSSWLRLDLAGAPAEFAAELGSAVGPIRNKLRGTLPGNLRSTPNPGNYLSHLSIEKWEVYRFLINAHYGASPYKTAPIRFFKFVWDLPAGGTEVPQNEVVDNLPRYAG